jgi:tetratricopeptide (TPR) repeat protein
LLAAVEELEAVDLIRSDGKRIACRHDLIRDSVLAGMPEATVRLLHTSAAQFLADSMDNASHISMLWALAKHWQKAGSKSEAFTTWKQVAHHLISVGVPADAAEALKHAAECLPTDSDRPALEQSLMHAYSLAAAWPQYLSLASKLNSYSRAANRPPEVSAPDILNARWRANENPFSVLEDAIMAANDTSESPNDRMRSLVIGLIISDNQCRKQAADSLHHALTTIDQNEVAPHILAEAQMIYNASFGELPIARESAMSLIAATRKKADVVATCRALRRASIPLIRCGDFSTAEDALSEALEISHDVGAPRDAVPTLHGLLGLHLTTQSLSKAAEAVEQLSVWIARYRSSWGLGALAAGRLRLALAVNDQVVIPDLYRELRTADWMTVGSRVHFGMIAWLLEAELALGRYENISTRVRHLRKFYTRAKSCGDFDVAATALLRGMYRIGEGPGAKTLGLSYVDRHRRELYPSSQDLLDAIEGKERG